MLMGTHFACCERGRAEQSNTHHKRKSRGTGGPTVQQSDMSEIGALPKSLLRTIIEVLGTSLNLVASSCQSFRMVARHIPRTLRQMNTHQMVMARPFLTSRDLLEVGLMLARCANTLTVLCSLYCRTAYCAASVRGSVLTVMSLLVIQCSL